MTTLGIHTHMYACLYAPSHMCAYTHAHTYTHMYTTYMPVCMCPHCQVQGPSELWDTIQDVRLNLYHNHIQCHVTPDISTLDSSSSARKKIIKVVTWGGLRKKAGQTMCRPVCLCRSRDLRGCPFPKVPGHGHISGRWAPYWYIYIWFMT